VAFVYGGLLLGSAGGATYVFLWHRRQRAQGAPVTLAQGAVFGLVAAVPYLIVDTVGSLASGGWHVSLATVWQDALVTATCAALGTLLALANRPARRAHQG